MSATNESLEPDTPAPSGVTYHSNVVTLKGACIKKIEWISGALMVSKGQDSGQNPTVTANRDEWAIDVYCGRDKTEPVANEFNKLNISRHHMWNPSAVDEQPVELNFYVGVKVELIVNGVSHFFTLYFAQGSNFWGNNWWVASPALVVNPSPELVVKPGQQRIVPITPCIVPITTVAGQIIQIVEIDSRSDNFFEASTWFERDSTLPDYRRWLADVNGSLSIAQVNLPGTHDSTAIFSWTSVPPYVCHSRSLTQQMASGIRLFDIRLKVKQDQTGAYYFVTCHGDLASSTGANEFQSFTSALDEFTLYLANFDREFLVVSLKIDDWGGYGSARQAVFTALSGVLNNYARYLQISANLPTVGALRGKIFLLNRITNDITFGAVLDVPDNTHGVQIGPGIDRSFSYWIQDWYKDLPVIGTEQAKFGVWLDATRKAGQADLVFNFASATQLTLFGVYIMGLVLAEFGKTRATGRPNRIGWSLFDYEGTQYQTTPYGAVNVVDLMIASNFGWRDYDKPFVVNYPHDLGS